MHSKAISIDQKKMFRVLIVFLTAVIVSFIHPSLASAASVNPWWPVNNAHMMDVQPFKAELSGVSVEQYQMYWQVDGGGLVAMDSNYTGYPHKEASVNVTPWTWRGKGPYVVTFVAKQNGTVVAQQSVAIYNDAYTSTAPTLIAPIPPPAPAPSPTPTPPPAPAPAPTPTPSTPTSGTDPLSGMAFWVNPNSSAAQQASLWSSSDPTSAALMRFLASQPTAQWFGGWNSNIQNDVHSTVANAQSAGEMPVLVAYNIPFRDCGGYSAGGATTASAYASWIQSFAAGIGSARVVVILEPDALATISCLSSGDAQTRLTLLNNAVSTLKANANTKVYIDAGHSGWIDHSQMANGLRSANIAHADGFALNVSNFGWTSDNTSYGTQISNDLGGAHFVIDTSRNGLGPTPDNQWCNPSGRGTGIHPTASTGNALIDAFLWLKVPGESDGNCNGGPNAGTWWPSYAVGLAQRGLEED